MAAFDAARLVVQDAAGARVFPAAAIEVGGSGGALWSEAFGTLTFDAGSAPASVGTPFDLASLTKVIATTSIVMELVRTGALRLEEPVAALFEDWRGVDREQVTIRDLLAHASGLPARLVDSPPATRREFEHDISTIRLEYEPRTQSVYSDLGFILLGFAAADRGGAPLATLFDRITVRLKADTTAESSVRLQPDRESERSVRLPVDAGGDRQADRGADLAFGVSAEMRQLTAPTRPLDDDARRGRQLAGEVHDNYAAALGGAAGHAGLFGTAGAVGAFARTVLRAARGSTDTPAPFTPGLVGEFTAKSGVPGSSRALGWDTMLPTSSCGARMSPQAFGHAGYTGTSLWIDPPRDRYFVLLTNRACGGGTPADMRVVRRAFHDALGEF
jgi:CubicO group peptidase (beta-lactamase class C family)